MLQLPVRIREELWDERKEEFIPPVYQTIQLEHSLVSISQWESRWNKPFLTKEDKTSEEILDYIKCMTVTENVDPTIYDKLTENDLRKIYNYINAPMTATTLPPDRSGKRNRERITSELIYYWMVALTIPFDPCERWHIARLLTLIQVCNIKNTPPKKMNKRDILSRNAALNEARKRKFNTTG